MHPAKSIINFYKAKFATIQNVANPTPDSGNSNADGLLSVSTSGRYVSTVDRTYTVTVVTGGDAGDAICSISDGIGGVYSNFEMVTGVELNLGSHGAKIRFDLLDPEYEFVAGDVWTVQCNHEYNYSIKEVKNARINPQAMDSLPGIAFTSTGLNYDPDGTSNNNTVTMRINADMWFTIPTNEDVEPYLFDAVEDFETAITDDPQCGGASEDIEIYECSPYLPVPGEPIAAISVEFGVRFYNRI
jgi:hypothetical protein